MVTQDRQGSVSRIPNPDTAHWIGGLNSFEGPSRPEAADAASGLSLFWASSPDEASRTFTNPWEGTTRRAFGAVSWGTARIPSRSGPTIVNRRL